MTRDYCDCGGTLEYHDDPDCDSWSDCDGHYRCTKCGRRYEVSDVEWEDEEEEWAGEES